MYFINFYNDHHNNGNTKLVCFYKYKNIYQSALFFEASYKNKQ